MMNMHNNKKRKIIVTVVAVILALSMIVPTALSLMMM